MGHEVESMFFYGKVPWHGLGKELANIATSKEALTAAGLTWSVRTTPMYVNTNGWYDLVPDKFAVIREDTSAVLGTVGRIYTPLQNVDAFRFFDDVVGSKEAKYVTAGSLRGGRRIWILAKVGGVVRIADSDDTVEKYVLLYNSHDGTSTVQMMITPVRVVCNNTLGMALHDNRGKVHLRHTPNLITNVSRVRDVLGIVNGYYDEFAEYASVFARTPVKSQAKFDRFLKLAGFNVKSEAKQSVDTRERLNHLFEVGKGANENYGSLWNAVNAVTEYVDHFRTTRMTSSFSSQEEARLDSQWFGSGKVIKQNAWDAALTMAS
jgi:phage/plasmid-like protein (TIGR03299 family)